MNLLKEMQKRQVEEVQEMRNELVQAWIAKTGVSPDQAILCHEVTGDLVTKFWVERRPKSGRLDTSGAEMSKACRAVRRDMRTQHRRIRIANAWQRFLTSIETLKGKIGL